MTAMRFAGFDIQINDYLMIDSYEGMKEHFYCGYVHYADHNYIHLCADLLSDELDLNRAVKVAIRVENIIGINKRGFVDCDLGI